MARCLPGFAAWLLFLVLLPGCGPKRTPVQNRPYEDLTTIVNEVILHRSDDIYRLPYPLDAEGKNLFSNAIVRLEAWARVHPKQCEDIVAYTQGLCHEKLGHLREAADAYARVPPGDADLPRLAPKRRDAMLDLLEQFRPPLHSEDPSAQAQLMEGAQARYDEAVSKYRGTEWDSLAKLCAENRAVEEVLEPRNRQSGEGERAYREAIERLIVRFPESKRIQEHKLRLGIYYEEAAREWITRAENGQSDAWTLAQKALDRATEIYVKVSQADGYPEKPEAAARLDAAEALSRKVDRNAPRSP